ncbi:MAG: apolipoprotein N-acyltransferase [Longimicrobiales bacterium]|nr:apolipoprotein N-acyltransferase [Longimicrobiales bacterium]
MTPPRDGRTLPVLSGVLLALAHPPVELLLPAFVGLVPLLVFIAERPEGPAGRWAAIRAGALTGVLYFGIQLYWVAVALTLYSALAVPAYLGLVAILALLTAGFGGAVHWSRERLGLPVAVAAVLFWTALEWVQGHAGDLAMPWLGLGAALAPFPTLAGAADLVGSRGLTAWVAGVNGLVATAFLRRRRGRPVGGVLAAIAVVLAGPAAYGVARDAMLETRPAARVAVVQPNIPEELKLDPAVAVDTSLSALTALTAGIDEPVDLVVWPEVAVPTRLEGDDSMIARIRALARDVGAPILVGAYGGVPIGAALEDAPTASFNSALLIAPDGPRGRYDKRRLVPFVERVPFIDPAWLGSGRLGGLGRGTGKPVLTAGEAAGFGTLICYESIFGDLSAGYRRDGADFLVNITNDAWFGRDTWYGRTTGLWQHPAHTVLRAVENRVGVARAANTGVSMFVDPRGRVYAATPLFQPAVRVETVYTTDEPTLYTRWGDWLATLLTALAALLLLAAAVSRPRSPSPLAPEP